MLQQVMTNPGEITLLSHSSVLSIVFESFYQLHNFLFYFLYNFSKFLNKKVPSLPHVHASKEGTFLISSLRTAFFSYSYKKCFAAPTADASFS